MRNSLATRWRWIDGQECGGQSFLVSNYESPFVLTCGYPEFSTKEILASVFVVVAQDQLQRELTPELYRLPGEEISPLDCYLVRHLHYLLQPSAHTAPREHHTNLVNLNHPT